MLLVRPLDRCGGLEAGIPENSRTQVSQFAVHTAVHWPPLVFSPTLRPNTVALGERANQAFFF